MARQLSRPFIVGHRGSPRLAPENTGRSFERAQLDGVDAVELDVQLTADGFAAVHHDPTTTRMCGVPSVIRRQSLDNCRRLRVRRDFPSASGDERILSLDEALAILRPQTDVNIELKGVDRDRTPLADTVLAAVERTGGHSGIMLSSANPRLLRALRTQSDEAQLGLVFGSRSRENVASLVRSLGLEWLVPNQVRCSEAEVQSWLQLGLRVMPYTVNDRQSGQRLVEMGVHGLITDVPRQARRWLTPTQSRRTSRKSVTAVVDIGSTRAKIAMVDSDLAVTEKESIDIQTVYGKRGEIGLDAVQVINDVTAKLTPMLRRHRKDANVKGLAIASQRSTFVAWDPTDGTPWGDAPSWRCRRGARLCRDLAHLSDEIKQRTGLFLAPSYSASKMCLKRQTAPDPKRLLFGPLPTYFAWAWSKGRIFRTDPTLAARTLLMNLSDRQWDPQLLELFGISKQSLPEIVPHAHKLWSYLDRGYATSGPHHGG